MRVPGAGQILSRSKIDQRVSIVSTDPIPARHHYQERESQQGDQRMRKAHSREIKVPAPCMCGIEANSLFTQRGVTPPGHGDLVRCFCGKIYRAFWHSAWFTSLTPIKGDSEE